MWIRLDCLLWKIESWEVKNRGQALSCNEISDLIVSIYYKRLYIFLYSSSRRFRLKIIKIIDFTLNVKFQRATRLTTRCTFSFEKRGGRFLLGIFLRTEHKTCHMSLTFSFKCLREDRGWLHVKFRIFVFQSKWKR